MPSSDPSHHLAVVTGANRGLGLETSRQLAQQGIEVILTSRDAGAGEPAASHMQSQGLPVVFHPLDVNDSASIARLGDWIGQQYGHLEILVNNAGILIEDADHSSVFITSMDAVRRTMETNVYGPLQLCQTLIPLMQVRGYGRVVNVSSGMGQLSDMGGGYTAYRLSKTALNAVTRIVASELQGSNILVNAACPGWVKTDMGGAGATRSIPEGADTLVWLATLHNGSPTGGYFRDRKPIPW